MKTKNVTLFGKDIKEYAIVCPSAEGTPERFAASELARYLGLAVGGEFTVAASGTEPMILVGPDACADCRAYEGDHEDAFTIDIADGVVRIDGGRPRGTVYGAYEFLEKYIGWRFIAHDCDYLKNGDIAITESVTDTQTPMFEWRDSYTGSYFPADIAVKRRVNSNPMREIPAERGGTFYYPGRFIHTMESLLGIPQHQMPCLTDETNIEKCIESVKALLRENPDARVISVSQNDAEVDEKIWCTCDRCREIDEREGSHAATMLLFVNRVAEAIAEEFPKVKIMTLAYLETIDRPKTIKPRDNVIIELAPIKRCHIHTLDDPHCRLNLIEQQRMNDWSEVTDKIYVWDYFVDFSFSVPHFPNMHTLWENMHYYSQHSVTGMFCQGDNSDYEPDRGSDFAEMRAYLLAKMLWEPTMTREDYDECARDFLDGYYGGAGKWIGKYLDILEEVVNIPEHHIQCFENPKTLVPRERYLAALPRMKECWDNAEKEEMDERQSEHFERIRLGFDYNVLLFTFDDEYAKADDATKAKMEKFNREFYEKLKKHRIAPRGSTTELPEVTDFTKSAGITIYW